MESDTPTPTELAENMGDDEVPVLGAQDQRTGSVSPGGSPMGWTNGQELLGRDVSGELLQPNSGELLQPNSGEFLQPNSGELLQPNSGELLQLNSGELLQPNSGELLRPNSGELLQTDVGGVATGSPGSVSTGKDQRPFRTQHGCQP